MRDRDLGSCRPRRGQTRKQPIREYGPIARRKKQSNGANNPMFLKWFYARHRANNREQTTRDKTHHRQSSKAALGAMPGQYDGQPPKRTKRDSNMDKNAKVLIYQLF